MREPEYVESEGCMVEVARPARTPRKILMVSNKTHAAVSSMTRTLTDRLGYRVTQSEAVKRGMEALEREMENGQ